MHLPSFAALTWISVGVQCTLTPFTYPGETIAHYLGLDIVNITDDAQVFANEPPKGKKVNSSAGSSDHNDTAGINNRDVSSITDSGSVPWKPSPVMGKSLLYRSAPVALSATYNDTEDRGYNITIPGCTPADTLLGDWIAPSGDLVENCTLAQMSQKLSLPSASLLDFTVGRAQKLLAKINSTLQNAVCEPPLQPPDRELKGKGDSRFRFNTETQTGYFSSLLLVIGGSFGLSFTGLHLGIIHEGITANISLTTEVLILSTFASLGTTCVVIVERERRHIARIEAIVLNAFLFLGEQIYDNLASSLQCVQEVPLKTQLQTVVDKLSQGARVLVNEDAQAAAMRTAGSSSVNLVAQGGDIENQLTNGRCGH